MTDNQERLLEVGDIVHGFCSGIFGRDHYDCCTVEALGVDWAVFRFFRQDHWSYNGTTFISGKENLLALRTYRRPVLATEYTEGCGCVEEKRIDEEEFYGQVTFTVTREMMALGHSSVRAVHDPTGKVIVITGGSWSVQEKKDHAVKQLMRMVADNGASDEIVMDHG